MGFHLLVDKYSINVTVRVFLMVRFVEVVKKLKESQSAVVNQHFMVVDS